LPGWLTYLVNGHCEATFFRRSNLSSLARLLPFAGSGQAASLAMTSIKNMLHELRGLRQDEQLKIKTSSALFSAEDESVSWYHLNSPASYKTGLIAR
jgi:hypothetical protein